jgi:hypothetical protein
MSRCGLMQFRRKFFNDVKVGVKMRQTNISMMHPNYRPDIDGLRAIAVLFCYW